MTNTKVNYMDKSCKDIVDIVASKAPVPGGGGISALVGALGTALGNMVGSLTVGKKKYIDVQDDMILMKEKADRIQKNLLDLVEADVAVLDTLLKAYGMPKNTKEEQQVKAETLEQALREACDVPMKIMESCCDAIDVIEEFAKKGSAMAISDAGVGAILCRSALLGASLNVYINTNSMKDLDYAKDCNVRTDEMIRIYGQKAEDIFHMVEQRLR